MTVEKVKTGAGHYIKIDDAMHGPMLEADADTAVLKAERSSGRILFHFLSAACHYYETAQKQTEIESCSE